MKQQWVHFDSSRGSLKIENKVENTVHPFHRRHVLCKYRKLQEWKCNVTRHCDLNIRLSYVFLHIFQPTIQKLQVKQQLASIRGNHDESRSLLASQTWILVAFSPTRVADPHHLNADPDPAFHLLGIRIWLLLLIKVLRICDYFERQRPSMAQYWAFKAPEFWIQCESGSSFSSFQQQIRWPNLVDRRETVWFRFASQALNNYMSVNNCHPVKAMFPLIAQVSITLPEVAVLLDGGLGIFSLVGICIRLYPGFSLMRIRILIRPPRCRSMRIRIRSTASHVWFHLWKNILSFINKETSMNASCFLAQTYRAHHLPPLLTLFH